MNPDDVIVQLELNGRVFEHAFDGVGDEQARWQPSSQDWSLLEVAHHLHDEEREDFRTRVDYCLHRPDAEWPAIHPQAWVSERRYNEQNFEIVIGALLAERAKSVEWLRGLVAPNWASTRVHPRMGEFTALDMLNAWLAHDYLHLRQINELKWKWLERSAAPLSLEYAGGW